MKAEPRNNNTIILEHDFSIEEGDFYVILVSPCHSLIIMLKLLRFNRASVNIGPTPSPFSLRHSFATSVSQILK